MKEKQDRHSLWGTVLYTKVWWNTLSIAVIMKILADQLRPITERQGGFQAEGNPDLLD